MVLGRLLTGSLTRSKTPSHNVSLLIIFVGSQDENEEDEMMMTAGESEP